VQCPAARPHLFMRTAQTRARSYCRRMMKSSIMVSSSSSQRRMNNAQGEAGSCVASPNDVHHRCRWQANAQILVLHGELQQELAQLPEAGQTSCFISGLVPMEGAAWLPLDHWQPNGASLVALKEASAPRCRYTLHMWAVCKDPFRMCRASLPSNAQ